MIVPQTQTEAVVLIPDRHKGTMPKPEITWEVLPLDFPIPDEPMDNTDQFLLAEALRDALSCAGYLSETRLYASSVAINAKVSGRTVLKAPDWFYVPYVHPQTKNRRSYAPIAEGSLPAVVMEFLSDNDGREYDDSPAPPYGKWYFYEQILKIPWYVIFDSEQGRLEVWHLNSGHYQKQIPYPNGRYWIDTLELFLGVWTGCKEDVARETFWLRWWDKYDQCLPWRYEKERKALEKAQNAEEKVRYAEEKAKSAERLTTIKIAAQMLQAKADIAFIAQVTGLNEAEILALDAEQR